MAAPSSRPDLNTLCDAYALLAVPYTASPSEIRRAFKQHVRERHPDRYPAGSPEQRQATERMTASNAAYELIREAPLRHHRIATGARPDIPWTDAELDAAWRRSRQDHAVSKSIPVVLSAIGIVVYVALVGWPSGAGVTQPLAGLAAIWVAYLMASQTNIGMQVWRVIDIFKLGQFVLRQLGGR